MNSIRISSLLALVVLLLAACGQQQSTPPESPPAPETPAPDENLTVGIQAVTSQTAIEVGSFHSCAIVTGGAVKCWGRNSSGQLGNGSFTASNIPVDVTGLGSGVTSIGAGSSHSCAVVGGGAKCWGGNFNGQLGNPTNSGVNAANTTPLDVTGLTSGVQAISAGGNHTCALTTGGGVKCWGENLYGQLGNGTTTSSNTPVDVTGLGSGVTAISVGLSHTCALTTSGGVKCWGRNGNGQLGNPANAGNAGGTNPTPLDVTGLGSGVTAISAGGFHTCAVAAGAVKCWGQNLYGQLGNGSNSDSAAPVNVSGLGSGATAVGSGYTHACAVVGGAVKCWGYNGSGQLGDGTNTSSNTPVDVNGLASGAAKVSGGDFHTCILTTVGGVKCWGVNGSGQLGNGTNFASPFPVGVTDMDPDGTPPVITPSITGTLGTNGWYTSDVTLRWQVSDPDSAISSRTGCETQNITADTAAAGVSFTCSATSEGGSGSRSVTVKVDKTAPTITLASRLPAANPAGWNNSNVTVTWNCADALSGVVSSTVNRVVSSEGSSLGALGTCTDNAGNTATNTQTGIKIDKTAPSVVAAATTSPNPNGWYNANVTVEFTCSDNVSSVVSCPPDQILSSEGNAVSSTAQTVTDQAGNSSSPSNVVTVKIDKTAPTITLASRLPAPNGAGWNNSNVTVAWDCADAGSGAVSSTVSQVVSTEGSSLGALGTCADNAGNTTTNTQTGIKIDKTAPTVSAAALSGPNGTNSWYTNNVTVRFTCSDSVSGLVSCPADQVLSAEGSSISSTAQAVTDQAGNSSVPSNVVAVKIDKTAPSIVLASRVPAPNGAGWNNSDVTVTWNCADATSGPVSATVSRTVSSQGAGQSAGQTCADQAGLTASSSVGGISIDKTAPTLNPVVNPNPVLRYLSATAAPNASDALSGLVGSSCPAPSTSNVGAQSVACTASDVAGNTNTAPASYTVISASSAISGLSSQVQGLPGLSGVNRTLLQSTLAGTRSLLGLGLRAQAASSMSSFVDQVNRIRNVSGGLTSAQADALIAQANLIIQSINAGG